MSLVGKSHTCLTVKNMGNLSQFPVNSFSKLLTHEARLGEVPGSGHGHHGVHSPGEVVTLEQEVAEEDGGGHHPDLWPAGRETEVDETERGSEGRAEPSGRKYNAGLRLPLLLRTVQPGVPNTAHGVLEVQAGGETDPPHRQSGHRLHAG